MRYNVVIDYNVLIKKNEDILLLVNKNNGKIILEDNRIKTRYCIFNINIKNIVCNFSDWKNVCNFIEQLPKDFIVNSVWLLTNETRVYHKIRKCEYT